jgi:Flp pilus assembly protein TadD
LIVVALAAASGACATAGDPVPVAAEPPPAQTALAAGDDAARRGDFEQALVHYLRALNFEETADSWLRLAAAATQLRESSRALQAYLKVIELDPMRAEAFEGAGLEQLALGQNTDARELLARAAQLDPMRWRPHNGLGILADRAGDHIAAIEHYETALDLNPDSPAVLNNLGYSKYLAGELDEAARDFYRATQVDPNYEHAWSNLALVYAQRGWYFEAVETLSRVMDKATAHNDIGYLAYRRGDVAQSEMLLTEAVRLSPVYYETAHRNLAAIRSRMQDRQPAPVDGEDAAGLRPTAAALFGPDGQ